MFAGDFPDSVKIRRRQLSILRNGRLGVPRAFPVDRRGAGVDESLERQLELRNRVKQIHRSRQIDVHAFDRRCIASRTLEGSEVNDVAGLELAQDRTDFVGVAKINIGKRNFSRVDLRFQLLAKPNLKLIRAAGSASHQNLLNLIAVLADQLVNSDRSDAACSAGDEYFCHCGYS